MGEGLRGQFLATELLAFRIFAFHQASEKIDSVGVGIVETLRDPRDGDTCQVLDRLDALAEERVGKIASVRFQLWKATQGSRDFSTTIQNFNRGSSGRRCVRRLADLRDIPFMLEHAKGLAKGEISNDVEGEIVKPMEGVNGGVTSRRVLLRLRQFGPLLGKKLEIRVDVLLELPNGFGGEGVRDDLALARVLCSVAGVE